jgi:dUTP pyrophosphatase
MITVEIKKLNENAKLPAYGSEFAAGADLCSLEDKLLAPGDRHLFKVGLAVAIPPGVYGRIAPRSGLAFKQGVDVLAGVIDEDYRGELGVILINHGSEHFAVKAGDKIAQIIFERYSRAGFVTTNELSSTVRGEGGYGSTGK